MTYGMHPDFYELEADHLRPGERIRIIAINRVTGYVGSITTEAHNASSEQALRDEEELIAMEIGGELSFEVDDIIMRPPNLKIWAKRSTTVEYGFTKDEEREYAVANEGAVLNGDDTVVVYTEWLDHDGTVFPEQLIDYGFTGRIATLTGSKTLSEANVGQFRIGPGRHMQLIQVKDSDLKEQQVYVQVNAEPKHRKPDFSGHNTGGGPLVDRPEMFVPFKVLVFNEDDTLKQYNAYRGYVRDEWSAGSDVVEKPGVIYNWRYRPDYTYSVFDLEIEGIVSKLEDEEPRDILRDAIPLLPINTEWVELLFRLNLTENEMLDRFTGEQELVFELGKDELLAEMNGDERVTFDNLGNLSQITSEDLTTIRLYDNSDPDNVFWEFAFVTKLRVNRVRETDNYCNVAPNRKQNETGYGEMLIVATEPHRPDYVEVLLDGVEGGNEKTRLRVEGNGQWVEAEVEKDDRRKEWRVSFEVQDESEDVLYTIHYYEDENGNEVYDNDENLELLEYRAGDLKVLAASPASYQNHLSELLSDVSNVTGLAGVGYELYSYFISGAPGASGYEVLEYRQEEVGTKIDTSRNDYLVNSWTHGAGATMLWSNFGGERCESVVPSYSYGSGHPLHEAVMESEVFHEGLGNIVSFNSFEKDEDGAIACSGGDECVQFDTSDLDIDIVFEGYIPRTVEANLFAALGPCKFKYDAQVRLDDGVLSDQYDIKITGEIYDMYDFNYGKENFGFVDFNSDDALIQLGYEGARPKGAVFVSSVPFELTYSLDCTVFIGCSFSNELLFSEEGDFQ